MGSRVELENGFVLVVCWPNILCHKSLAIPDRRSVVAEGYRMPCVAPPSNSFPLQEMNIYSSNIVQGKTTALDLNISLFDESNENSHSTLTSFAMLHEEHVLLSPYLYSNRSSERECLRNYNRHSKRVYPVLPFSGICKIPTKRVTLCSTSYKNSEIYK